MICSKPRSIARQLARMADTLMEAAAALDPDHEDGPEDDDEDAAPKTDYDTCDQALEELAEVAKDLVEQVGYLGQLREECRRAAHPVKIKKTPPPSRRKKRTKRKG